MLGRDHPLTLIAMNHLARAYSEADRFDDALKLFRDVLRLTTETLGPDHPDTLRDMVNLGAAYRDVGRPAKALPLFESALERMKEVLDPDHPDALVCADHLAGTYLALGRTGEGGERCWTDSSPPGGSNSRRTPSASRDSWRGSAAS